MNTFTLSVLIDGDHIENDHHVAEVLRAVADTLREGDESGSTVTPQPVGIYSARRVGEWAVNPTGQPAIAEDVAQLAAGRVLTRYGVEANGDGDAVEDLAWMLGGEVTYEEGLRAFAAEVLRTAREAGSGA